MPFPADKIVNWTRHEAVNGRCVQCGLPLHESVSGIVWAKPDGDVLTCPPQTNWTRCA